MIDIKTQPWKPADATKFLNQLTKADRLNVIWTKHARDRMRDRDLIVSDVLFVLKGGFVYAEPEPSTQVGLYKYQIESRSPNSNGRTVRVVAIPDAQRCCIKVVTVMWMDE